MKSNSNTMRFNFGRVILPPGGRPVPVLEAVSSVGVHHHVPLLQGKPSSDGAACIRQRGRPAIT
jgi:hypothetical protein